MKKYPGTLITVEGIDGSGKSTLVTGLEKKLLTRGHPVVPTREPGGTPFGKKVIEMFRSERDSLSGEAEFLLFAADRAQHFHDVVIPALQKGSMVISDRSGDSSLAYQGHAKNISIEMIKQINSWVMQSREPSLVFYLKLSLQQARTRIIERKKELTSFEKEQEDYWKRVISGYDAAFQNRPEVHTLNAQLAPEQLVEKAMAIIEKKVL